MGDRHPPIPRSCTFQTITEEEGLIIKNNMGRFESSKDRLKTYAYMITYPLMLAFVEMPARILICLRNPPLNVTVGTEWTPN
jgi:hypothetical protein